MWYPLYGHALGILSKAARPVGGAEAEEMSEYLSLQEKDYQEADLWYRELLRRTVRDVSLPVLIFGYIAMAWIFFQHETFGIGLLPPIVLWVGMWLSRFLSTEHLTGSVTVYVCTLVLSGLSYLVTQQFQMAPYIVVAVVILTGIVLKPAHLLYVTLSLGTGLLAIPLIQQNSPVSQMEIVYAIGALILTAGCSHLASRNLYSALRWAWQSYEDARKQRERARSRQARLGLALKALDGAADRLQRINYELNRARAVAEEMRSLQQHFTATISHELRTPLALIAGFSEMIYMAPESYGAPLPPAYAADVREIYRNSQQLLNLINDVLEISQLRSRKLQLRREKVNLPEVIADAVETIRPLIEGKGLSLSLEIDPHLSEGFVDPLRVRQVLINLLNNARRFTDSGEVTVKAELAGEVLRVSVSDTGIGIPPDEHDQVFEAFRQLGRLSRRPLDGVGLGLAISKDFVEMHGGRIWVESTGIPGEGSTFHFELPINIRNQIVKPSLRRTPDSPYKSLISQQFHPTLLVVSSDSTVGKLIEEHLHCHVVLVAHLPDLPRLIKEVFPVAVLVVPDPSDEGSSFERVRLYTTDWEVPVILCPLNTQRHFAQSVGANVYLTKPVTRAAIINALESVGGNISCVLIIDDDPRFVRLLSQMLRSAGRAYRILTALSGEEGLDLLRSNNVDAVVLDLLMPGLDGFGVLDHIRQTPSLAQIPVVVITGREIPDSDTGGRQIVVSYSSGLPNDVLLDHVGAFLDAIIKDERASED